MNLTSDNKITVVVDVFRAMTTAAYVLDQEPEHYCLSTSSSTLQKLSQGISNLTMLHQGHIIFRSNTGIVLKHGAG